MIADQTRRSLCRVQRRQAGGIQSADGWSGFQGTGTPLGRWVQEERNFTCEGSNTDMFAWSRLAQCQSRPSALGDKTGERSSPLFKIVWYYHTHLAAHLSAVRWPQGSQRMVSSDTHLAPSSVITHAKKQKQSSVIDVHHGAKFQAHTKVWGAIFRFTIAHV